MKQFNKPYDFLIIVPVLLTWICIVFKIPNLETCIYNVLNLLIESRFRVFSARCNVHLMPCAQFVLMSNDDKICFSRDRL